MRSDLRHSRYLEARKRVTSSRPHWYQKSRCNINNANHLTTCCQPYGCQTAGTFLMRSNPRGPRAINPNGRQRPGALPRDVKQVKQHKVSDSPSDTCIEVSANLTHHQVKQRSLLKVCTHGRGGQTCHAQWHTNEITDAGALSGDANHVISRAFWLPVIYLL